MEMEDHLNTQYNIDLRHFITAGRPTLFPPPPPTPPSLSLDHLFSRNHHNYDMTMLMPPGGSRLHEFHSDSTSNPHLPLQSLLPSPSANSGGTTIAAACSTPSFLCPLDADAGSFGGADGGTGRWPRQETLTLLEIRSRLDPRFKEANQKGPLWDELSRIMCEEYGYQRSGKKCREKFENLYKYYKKTKEGKAGRQNGKHYRFFRQLEALYGETSNPCSGIPESQFGGTSSVQFHTGINMTSNIIAAHENSHSILSLSNSSGFDTCSSEDNSSEKRRKRRSWKAKIKEFIDSQMRKLIEKQETWLEKLTNTLEQNEQKRMIREERWRNEEAARVEKEHKFWDKEKEWIEARDAALMDTLRKLIGRDQCSPDHQIGRIREQNPENNKNESITISNKKRKENSNCYYQSNYQETANTSRNQENADVAENCFPFLMSEENLWENYGLKISKGN